MAGRERNAGSLYESGYQKRIKKKGLRSTVRGSERFGDAWCESQKSDQFQQCVNVKEKSEWEERKLLLLAVYLQLVEVKTLYLSCLENDNLKQLK